jgi:glycosyltransferase involved in cell wall biosynthesis
MQIRFSGTVAGVGTSCGYGYTAVELIKAWQALKVPVWWWGDNCDVCFNFAQPYGYDFPGEHNAPVTIGYTPWESTKIPYGWADLMNQMDEVWTTSEACKDWFINNGVYRRVRVLPHGINSEHFPLTKRSLAPGDVFRFLHIGEPAERKGGQIVYEAFCDLFAGNNKVSLTLKGNPRFKVDAPNVNVIREDLSQEELRGLYLSHHAMVYPTSGEGFGLIPFQAAATGMPTLVTDWSGPHDYIKYCWPIKVTKLVNCTYEPHEGLWAEPSVNQMKLWMEYFVDSPNYFFGHAYLKGKKLHREWSWESIGKLSLTWFNELLEAKRS